MLTKLYFAESKGKVRKVIEKIIDSIIESFLPEPEPVKVKVRKPKKRG